MVGRGFAMDRAGHGVVVVVILGRPTSMYEGRG
jgi:hypothetical protein